MKQAEALYGLRAATHNRNVTVESMEAPARPHLSKFLAAGVHAGVFLRAGFELQDLVRFGLSGSCYADTTIQEPAFTGLEGKWGGLRNWTIFDLVAARATLTEIRSLGATLSSLIQRKGFRSGFLALSNVTMEDWKEFGLVKAHLMELRLTPHEYTRLGWTFQNGKACWNLSVAEMTHIGFRLKLGTR
jgi:hypothetical protein